MRTVIDLGCAERGGADSLAVLAAEYRPDMIIGFDPSPELDVNRRIPGVETELFRLAAWIATGSIGFLEDGSGSRIGDGDYVACFDFSTWLREGEFDEIIVKMDIEGAEVPVLSKMMSDRTDELMDELLVEWHGVEVHGLRCPVREWWL